MSLLRNACPMEYGIKRSCSGKQQSVSAQPGTLNEETKMRKATSFTSFLVALLAVWVLSVPRAQAQTLTVLHSFTGGNDGAYPFAGLIADKTGDLYGTASAGGFNHAPYGYGTVFKLDTTGEVTVLHSFTFRPDGAFPVAGLIRDKEGNLYGTTESGGAPGCFGTVFKVDATGKETVLHSFPGTPDGLLPLAGLIMDKEGNLYGTTYDGGDSGVGTVFKLGVTGKETVLYSFTGGADGGFPLASLVRDKEGNLYATTFLGGDYGFGTVFKLDTTGKETVLLASWARPMGHFPWLAWSGTRREISTAPRYRVA
jgi:uncharacterized repeat protein (TIGR03803 family)